MRLKDYLCGAAFQRNLAKIRTKDYRATELGNGMERSTYGIYYN